VNGGKIGTCRAGEPTDAADKTLVSGCPAKLGRRIIVISRGSNGVNRHARTVRCSRESHIAGVLEEALDKIGGKARLIEMDRNGHRSNPPQKMNAKKPFDDSHEINFAALGQQTTEQSFNGGIFGEIYEVVNVETTGER
jgi:hypothetical protein